MATATWVVAATQAAVAAATPETPVGAAAALMLAAMVAMAMETIPQALVPELETQHSKRKMLGMHRPQEMPKPLLTEMPKPHEMPKLQGMRKQNLTKQ